jgi:TPR repeat protein
MRKIIVARLWVVLFVSSAMAANCNTRLVYDRAPKPAADFVRLIEKANRGDSSAQAQVGMAYETGTGVECDYEEARHWLQLAADHGDQAAQTNIGGMYANGFGVPQSDREAMRWYVRAASQGFAPAQTNVGHMYQAGRGVNPTSA